MDISIEDRSIDLLKAAVFGKTDEVLWLIANGADPNFTSRESGVSPLYNAVVGNQVACVRALVEAGANPDQRLQIRSIVDGKVTKDATALMFARSLDLARVLLSAGADPNSANAFGVTPLIAACGRGTVEVINELLTAGARTDAMDRYGKTPKEHALSCLEHYRSLEKSTGSMQFREKADALRELLSSL